jgi:hypothetical protein
MPAPIFPASSTRSVRRRPLKTEASSSFLKKRTKKLLFTVGVGPAVATARRTTFFASFCSQKEALASLLKFESGRFQYDQPEL